MYMYCTACVYSVYTFTRCTGSSGACLFGSPEWALFPPLTLPLDPEGADVWPVPLVVGRGSG